MFLEEISNPSTIVEASDDYGRKLYFDYRKDNKGKELLSSPSPIVLYLGTWRMTDKQGNKKKFICGLNLAYLADEGELAAVQHALPDILKVKNMKSRYRIGKNALPDIFRRAYRTYNVNSVVTRPIRGRLYTLKTSDEDKSEAQNLASRDGLAWDELENQDKNQYIDQAVRKRGSEDKKRQEKSKKEREQIDQYMAQREEPEEEPEALEEPETPEDELMRKPGKPPKPKPPARPLPPKPSKPPAKPIKQELQPLELGPGYEKPVRQTPPKRTPPKRTPHKQITQSPLKSASSGTATPQHIKVKKPKPEPEHGIESPSNDTPHVQESTLISDKTITEQARKVISATHQDGILFEGVKHKVIAYNQAGFTIKAGLNESTFTWADAPGELAYQVKFRAIDTNNSQEVFDLGMYTMRRLLRGKAALGLKDVMGKNLQTKLQKLGDQDGN